MANRTITAAIHELLEQASARKITVREFANRFPGHVSALEGLSYSQIKQAEMAGSRLRLLAEEASADQDVHDTALPLLMELQYWLIAVPGYQRDDDVGHDQPMP